jgi:hemoglobin-like flavoprotein
VARQRQTLLGALVLLGKSLRDLGTIVPAPHGLGARYAPYGVRPEHYPIVGAALLVALTEVGGNEWRDEYTRAWAGAWVLVQESMLSGVPEPRPSRERQLAVPSAVAA